MPGTVYVNYADVITDSKARTFMGICSEIISHHKPDELYFIFSSLGGTIISGVHIYNFLRALPLRVVMHNASPIDSIATVVFLGADQRFAAPHSTFLFHGVAMPFNQGSNLNVNQLHEVISGLRHNENTIAGIVAERTELTEGEIRELFRQGESKDLRFAQEKGIIQDIRPIHIPPDALSVTINAN